MLKRFFSFLIRLFSVPAKKDNSTNIEAISALPTFDEIDNKKLATSLDLIANARKYGEKNVPLSTDTVLSGVESTIRSKIEEYRAKCAGWRDSRLNIQDRNLMDLVVQAQTQSDNAILIRKNFEQKVNDLLSQNKVELAETERSYRSAAKELQDFQTKHNLHRESRTPTGGKRFFMISFLLLMVAIEGIANAYFFAQGSDSGLLGGFIQAVLFAGVNVGLAAAQGRYTLPFLYHRHIALKSIGIVALLLALLIILTVAFGVSHYRDAMEFATEDTAKVALAHLKADPFAFKDINSWLLCGITCLFGILALFDGLHLNDPYPFYGKTMVRYEIEKADYESLIGEIKEEIETFKEEAFLALDNAEQMLRQNLVQQDRIINDKINTHSIYESRMEFAEKTMQGLVQTFRNENMAWRTTPPPAYFNQEIELKKINLQAEFDPTHDRENLDMSEKKAAAFFSEMANFKAEINRSFNEQFEQFEAIYHIDFNGEQNG